MTLPWLELFAVILMSTSVFGASLLAPLSVGDHPPLPTKNLDILSYEGALSDLEKNCSSDSCQLWAQFVRGSLWARDDRKKACEIFSKLSLKEDGPLYPVVLVRVAENCKPDQKEQAQKLFSQIQKYIDTYKAPGKIPRWLHSTLIDASLPLTLFIDAETYVATATTAAKLSRSKKNKVLNLSSALEQAKKISEIKTAEILQELYRVSPRMKPLPDDWFAVGTDAMAASEYEMASSSFERVVSDSKTSLTKKRAALDSLKHCYKALQKKSEALGAVQRLWKLDLAQFKMAKRNKEAAKNLLSSSLSLVRFQWTEHNAHEALALLKQAQEKLKGHVAISDIFFVRSLIFQEQGKTKGGLEQLKVAAKNTNDLRLKSQYQWTYGWLNYKHKNYLEAIAAFSNLKEIEQDAGNKSKETFWLGKAYKNNHQLDEAKSQWNEVITSDPLGYYSLLAYRELGEDIPLTKDIASTGLTKIPKKIPRTQSINWNFFDWLVSVGENGLARQLLDEEVGLPDMGVEDWFEIFQKYAQAGNYAAIFAKLSRLSSEEKEKLISEYPELLFPTPFSDLVDDAGARSGLWPEYIFSIMRQESSFDTLAVSPANAFGLLQLIPSVAKSLSKQNLVSYHEPTDLLEPVLNTQLGALHLRNYWNDFNGQFILTTAAYNASPESVKNWVKNRYKGDALEFIEDIPYEETRTYVKLVLRNFINYRRLRSSAAFPFPDWCLQGIHASKD